MKKSLLTSLLIFFSSVSVVQAAPDLRVSDDNRWLERRDTGEKVFMMADSAWRLFALTPEEQNFYFSDRKSKGFNSFYIGLMTYWSTEGREKNANGVAPLNDETDTLDWNWGYFNYMKSLIERAERNGFYVYLMVGSPANSDRPMFVGSGNTTKARAWGKKVAEYFNDNGNIIYSLGQDRWPDTDGLDLHRAMAEGLLEGTTGQSVAWNQESPYWDDVLITYHPRGSGNPASYWFHTDPWLSLESNQIYSGNRQDEIWDRMQSERALSPTKPVWLMEGTYEGRTQYVPEGDPIVDAYWMRYTAYNAFMGGGFGTSYGYDTLYRFTSEWRDYMGAGGSYDMKHVVDVFTDDSKPFWDLLTDQSIVGNPSTGFHKKLGMISKDKTYGYIYLPRGGGVDVLLSKFSPDTVELSWMDASNGNISSISSESTSGTKRFTAPASGKGNDYVLIIESASGSNSDPDNDGDWDGVDQNILKDNFDSQYSIFDYNNLVSSYGSR